MELAFSGSCNCGNLRFEAKGQPLFQGFCHCPDCRKMGSGHVAAISMPAKDATIIGEYKSYSTTGTSGAVVDRNFCPICGNNVFNSYPSADGSIGFNAAMLDNPEVFDPQVVLFERCALPWDHVDPLLPRSEAMPVARSK